MTTAISVAPQAVALSPGQLGQRWGTSVAKVLALIHAGELHAINIADDPDGVPRFKVLLPAPMFSGLANVPAVMAKVA